MTLLTLIPLQTRAQSLSELRTWLLSQPHLVNCRTDDNFLLRFLRMQKYKVGEPAARNISSVSLTRYRRAAWCWKNT